MANQGERYAQISETLIDHPKMTELSRSMRINRFQLLGHLTCLWNWAMKNAPDGDLSRFSSRHIADAARITDADDFSEESDEKAQQFVTALVNCRTHDGGAGFLETIEGQIVIHDWDQYGGKFGTKVDKNAFFSWIKRQRDKGIIIPTTDENFDIWSQDRDALLSHFTTDTVATVSQHKSDTFATPSDLNSKAKQSKAKQSKESSPEAGGCDPDPPVVVQDEPGKQDEIDEHREALKSLYCAYKHGLHKDRVLIGKVPSEATWTEISPHLAALEDLLAMGATPDEVMRATAKLRVEYEPKGMPTTPGGLVKAWARVNVPLPVPRHIKVIEPQLAPEIEMSDEEIERRLAEFAAGQQDFRPVWRGVN